MCPRVGQIVDGREHILLHYQRQLALICSGYQHCETTKATSHEPEGATTEHYPLQIETRHQDSCSSIDFPEYIFFWYVTVLKDEFASITACPK